MVDKRISKGRRHTSYYIKVMPWGHHYDTEEITVDYQKYNRVAVGETVEIDLKNGLFGIPWYYIDK